MSRLAISTRRLIKLTKLQLLILTGTQSTQTMSSKSLVANTRVVKAPSSTSIRTLFSCGTKNSISLMVSSLRTVETS